VLNDDVDVRIGPMVQLADTPSPLSATLGLRPVT